MHPAVLDSVSQYCYIACMRYDQLLSELSDALERGDVSPRAVERLMRRSRPAARPDLPGLLRALGALTMFAGAAMLYAIQYHSLGTTTQRVSPLIFPVVALAAAVALRRAGRPSWEVELAGVVGFVAYGMAVATIGVSADAGVRFGVLAGLVAAAVVILMHRLLGITRLTVWGLSASLVAVTGFGAAQAGIVWDDLSRLLLAQAVAAALVGAVVLGRFREVAEAAWRTSALLAYAACLDGIGEAGWSTIGPWHALLTLVVVAIFVAAVTLDMPGLVWIAALGGLVWLCTVSAALGHSSGWAVAVIVLGAGLLGLGLAVNRFGRHGGVTGPTAAL